MARLCSTLLLSLWIASSASAVTMAWTPIGNPGNAADDTGFGAVDYAYWIGTYEVTKGQWTEFLNAKAASDPYSLYKGSAVTGIFRSGTPGSYTYSVSAGAANLPTVAVSFYDALRFANWMNNGQGGGDTESGAYTLLGGTAIPSNGSTVTRNAGATIAVPSEDEWYKAAYHDPSAAIYYDYPAGSDSATICSTPTAEPNRANCGLALSVPTFVGSYTGSASPYGTFDQGGNVFEWTEAISGSDRIRRGGAQGSDPSTLAATVRFASVPSSAGPQTGLRLALIPEPDTGLLVVAGLLAIVRWRSRT
jgi:formylglycine-generating enzyme required for sulfatase activity